MSSLRFRPLPLLLALLLGLLGIPLSSGPAYAATVTEVTFNNVSGSAALDGAPDSRTDSDDVTVRAGAPAFLPASANRSQLNGWVRRDNGTTTRFGPGDYRLTATGDYTHRLTFTDGSTVTVHQSRAVPAMFIRTTGGLRAIEANKDHKDKNGSVALVGADAQPVYNGVLDEIKGRGNSTWHMPKKPYQIKLGTSTELVPDAGKSRTWILLANYLDQSLIRNQVVYGLEDSVQRRMGKPNYAIKGRMIDLFIDGDFRGSYYLTEKVEVGSSRVDITDLESANEEANPNTDLDDAPLVRANLNDQRFAGLAEARYAAIPNSPPSPERGGYLLEMDHPHSARLEASYVITRNGAPIVVKAPELASEAQLAFVGRYLQDTEDAIFSKTGRNARGKHFTEYLDVESVANHYVLQELAANDDAFISSTFFYLDAGGKLVASPLWDFDRALGSVNYGPAAPSLHVGNPARLKPRWIKQLLAHTEFRTAVRNALNNRVGSEVDALLRSGGTFDRYASEVAVSAALNKLRWAPAEGIAVFPTPREDIAYLRSYMSTRIAALRRYFGSSYTRNVMLPDGVYTIQNGALRVDLANNSGAAGANMQLWSPNDSAAQKFFVHRGSDSFYTITNIGSGQALDVQWGGAADGTNVWQYPRNGGLAQKWSISTMDGVNYTIASQIGLPTMPNLGGPAEGPVLDAALAGTTPGTNLQVWRNNGSSAQQFQFTLVGAVNPELRERTYSIESAVDRRKVVDVQWGSPADQANIHLWSYFGSAAQRFTLDYLDNGRYQIRTGTRPNGAVDVTWGGTAVGTNVWQWAGTSSLAQQWMIRPTGDGDGSYYIVSAVSGLYLDVAYAGSADGTNIWTWSHTGTRAQKFYFTPR